MASTTETKGQLVDELREAVEKAGVDEGEACEALARVYKEAQHG